MGFNSVTFGFKVCKYCDWMTILDLIAEDYTLIGSDGEMHDWIIKIHLHEDLVCARGREFEVTWWELIHNTRLSYVHNQEISIGISYCCYYMIYVGQVGGDRETRQVIIREKTLADLLQWKQRLVEEDRVDEEIQLQMLSNCCS
jgi:hypothetical protein